MSHIVFVYGTLKKHFGNHHILQDSKYLGNDKIKGYDMYSLGPFPGIVESENGEGIVQGELYEVNDEVLKELDRLEGYSDSDPFNSLYIRKETVSINGTTCYFYEYNKALSVFSEKIEMGFW